MGAGEVIELGNKLNRTYGIAIDLIGNTMLKADFNIFGLVREIGRASCRERV